MKYTQSICKPLMYHKMSEINPISQAGSIIAKPLNKSPTYTVVIYNYC